MLEDRDVRGHRFNHQQSDENANKSPKDDNQIANGFRRLFSVT
jgi:hypothetical protein